MGYFAGGIAAAVFADDWNSFVFVGTASEAGRIMESLAAVAVSNDSRIDNLVDFIRSTL